LTGTQPTATTTPSPTFTGTPTIVPSLKVVVTPFQAKKDETFRFTIEVGSIGTYPTRNNYILDTFDSYLTVTNVSAVPRGVVTKLTNQFSVNIGDIFPGEKITITADVKVNSTLSETLTKNNVVTLYYDVSKSTTAFATYKVVYSTLPGTGELPLNWSSAGIKTGALIPGILLLGLGGILLFMGIWSKANQQKDKLWMIVVGVLMILVGFVVGVNASGLINPHRQAQENQVTPTSVGIVAQMQPGNPIATNLPRLPASAFSTPEAVVPIVTLPDYPIPTPKITVTPQPGNAEPDTSGVERIVIPVLLLDTEVKYVPYDGFTWLITGLRQEVAWMGNTSWPGLGGNTALAGHVTVAGLGDGPFRHLDELPTGELVLLYTEKNIYTYHVRESRVTDDGDMSVTLPTDNPQITLITCVDWDQDSHTYLHRLIVIADLVDTEPITIGNLP
jgi:LPXTG-site transpeptidase (sortase) family protein